MECPSCRSAVPDGAGYCPWCGAAVNTPHRSARELPNRRQGPETILIEQTAKTLKAAQLASALVCLGGCAVALGAESDTGHAVGAVIFMVALGAFCVVRIVAWWRHG